jgi:hypothetical protein
MAIDETPASVETKRKRDEEDTWDIEMEDDGADLKRQNVQKTDAPKLGATKTNSKCQFVREIIMTLMTCRWEPVRAQGHW